MKKVSHSELTNRLWDALRLEACSTGLKAQRIVMVNKEDISKALRRLNIEVYALGEGGDTGQEG